jgi:hypothetical protein
MNFGQDTQLISDRIIDLILNSDLNIEIIPDELERDIYHSVFDAIEHTFEQITLCNLITMLLRRLFCFSF